MGLRDLRLDDLIFVGDDMRAAGLRRVEVEDDGSVTLSFWPPPPPDTLPCPPPVDEYSDVDAAPTQLPPPPTTPSGVLPICDSDAPATESFSPDEFKSDRFAIALGWRDDAGLPVALTGTHTLRTVSDKGVN